MMRSIRLTDAEILHLRTVGRAEVAAEVAMARERLDAVARYPHLTPARAGFIADVVREGLAQGRVTHLGCRVGYCFLCERAGTHRTVRGKVQTLDLPGHEYAVRFVRVAGSPHLGCCADCAAALEPDLVAALAEHPISCPEHWAAAPHDWLWFERRRCACGWTGHDGQLLRDFALSVGTYPKACPACKASRPERWAPAPGEAGPDWVVVRRDTYVQPPMVWQA